MEAALKKEYTLRISSANRCGLVVIVYEICLDYLAEAKELCAKDDIEGFRLVLDNARNCIVQQMASLDMTQALSASLMPLYVFCIRELARADRTADTTYIDHVSDIIGKLRDAFSEIEKQDDSMPVMDHAQTVYAGLTYGVGGIREEVMADGSRGFMA